MCCKINIVHSISLTIGVNVQKWFLSPTVPKNKPYVHAYFRYVSKHICINKIINIYIFRFKSFVWGPVDVVGHI